MSEQEEAPRLVGDGVADDTDAVQWYFDRHLPLPPVKEGGSYMVRPDDLRFTAGGHGLAVLDLTKTRISDWTSAPPQPVRDLYQWAQHPLRHS